MKAKIQLTCRELCDGYPVGGINLVWEKGSTLVVSQEWEHRTSGPVWSEMEIHEVPGGDIFPFIKEWDDIYILTNVEEIS